MRKITNKLTTVNTLLNSRKQQTINLEKELLPSNRRIKSSSPFLQEVFILQLLQFKKNKYYHRYYCSQSIKQNEDKFYPYLSSSSSMIRNLSLQ